MFQWLFPGEGFSRFEEWASAAVRQAKLHHNIMHQIIWVKHEQNSISSHSFFHVLLQYLHHCLFHSSSLYTYLLISSHYILAYSSTFQFINYILIFTAAILSLLTSSIFCCLFSSSSLPVSFPFPSRSSNTKVGILKTYQRFPPCAEN